MSQLGKLYLLPVPISDDAWLNGLPAYAMEMACQLDYFIAENAKEARRFLKLFGYQNLPAAEIALLNEHTNPSTLAELLEPLMKGRDAALMSDAGCPGIADPGADVIALAHSRNIEVMPLVGPSSIVLSIMASGFNGQNFAFVGYLPVDRGQRTKRIKELELLALKNKQAQFFIETPYRNRQLLETLLATLSASTRLFAGIAIGSNTQRFISCTVGQWKKITVPDMNKIPVVFGIYV